MSRALSDKPAGPPLLTGVVPDWPVSRNKGNGILMNVVAGVALAPITAAAAVVTEPLALAQRVFHNRADIDRRVSLGELKDILHNFAERGPLGQAALGLECTRWMQRVPAKDIEPDAAKALSGIVDQYLALPQGLRDDVRSIVDSVSMAERVNSTLNVHMRHLNASERGEVEPLLDLWKTMSVKARQAAWPTISTRFGFQVEPIGAGSALEKMSNLVPVGRE